MVTRVDSGGVLRFEQDKFCPACVTPYLKALLLKSFPGTVAHASNAPDYTELHRPDQTPSRRETPVFPVICWSVSGVCSSGRGVDKSYEKRRRPPNCARTTPERSKDHS